eukprot:Tamp_04483.p1 GENE.Tamp_04483~~Tamp_04483.p1  ORF type:complete len:738 (-),score=242.55 Tamp_04483:22-2235(-)
MELVRSTSDSSIGSSKESEKTQKLINDKRKLALEVRQLKEELATKDTKIKNMEKEKDKDASTSGEPAPKASARRGGRARDDGDGDVSKLQEKLKGKEDEANKLKASVKELEGKVATLTKSSSANKLSLDRALEKGEGYQLKLKAAEKAGAEAEKKLANATAKVELLQAQLLSSGATMAQEAAGKLEEKVSELEGLIAQGQLQLQSKSDEANMLKKEVVSLKTQIAALEKDKAKDPAPLEEPEAVGAKRKKGRYSIQDTDELMTKLGGLQAQFLEIQKAGAAVKGRKPDLNSSMQEQSRDSGVSAGGSRSSNADELAALQEQVTKLNGDLESEREYVSQMDAESQRKDALLKELQQDLAASENARRRLHNQVMELKGNIRVFCRVRPFMTSDAKNGDVPSELVLRSSGDRPQVVVNQAAAAGGKNQKMLEHAFEMDNIFMHNASQEHIFEEIEPLLQSVMDGYRLCIFAYGQTGSGKTHTMEGSTKNGSLDEQRGVVPRALESIILIRDRMLSCGWEVKLEASALEIYNEVIRDLLGDDDKKKLDVAMDAKGEATVKGLSSWPVASEAEIYQLLQAASKKRETASTCHNQVSSRSHSVLQIKVLMKHKQHRETRRGVLNLIDLAGSEKVTQEHDAKAFKEAQNINKSLSSLLGVISALAAKQKHVPFRDSKLTYLLSSSLSGDGKALMFANVSPRLGHVSETINTLRFAQSIIPHTSCPIPHTTERQQRPTRHREDQG